MTFLKRVLLVSFVLAVCVVLEVSYTLAQIATKDSPVIVLEMGTITPFTQSVVGDTLYCKDEQNNVHSFTIGQDAFKVLYNYAPPEFASRVLVWCNNKGAPFSLPDDDKDPSI